jgi:mannosyltransferase
VSGRGAAPPRPAGLPWPWLAGLLAAGLAFRLTGLTERGLWLDEWVSLRVAAHPLADVAAGRAFDNHTPPLYYLLLHLWLALVPAGLAGLRSLSVLVDLGVLVLLSTSVARWFGRREGLAAGAAHALSPFAARLAQEGRMYPLLMLLVLAAAVLAVEVERRPERRWPAIAVAPVAAAALYTHYYAALSLLALHAVTAWRLRRRPALARRWWRAMAAAALLFAPWLPVVVGLAAGGGQHFRGPGWSELPHALLRFTVGYSLAPVTLEAKRDPWAAVLGHLPLLAAVGLAAAAALLLGAWRALRQRRRGGTGGAEAASPAAAAAPVVLALAAVPPALGLAMSLAVPSLDERYLAAAFPFFVVLLVLGVTGRGGAAARGLVAALLAALWLAGAAAQAAEPAAGATPWRPATDELRRAASPGAVVAVAPGYYAGLVESHLGDGYEVLPVGDLAPPRDGGPQTWLLEVAHLADRAALLRRRGWRAVPHRLLPDGNGLRLRRLAPASAAVDGALVADPHHQHDRAVVLDGADETVTADPVAP